MAVSVPVEKKNSLEQKFCLTPINFGFYKVMQQRLVLLGAS